MTKKVGQGEAGEDEGAEEGEGGEGEEKAPELDTETKTKLAERDEFARENADLKAQLAAKSVPAPASPPPGGYTVASFPEAHWAEAEAQTGLDRKTLLLHLNSQITMDAKVRTAVGGLEARLSVQQEKEALAAEDPLYPKYRKEVDKFLADVPNELLATPEGRRKWLGKAFEWGKRSVKLPASGRAPQDMDTRESGKTLDKKTEKGYSPEEEQVFQTHGMKAEDYDKIKHPFMRDGIVLKTRPEAPSFRSK